MKLLVVIVLAAALLFLVRRRYLQVDLSFPLFAALIVLGFASMSEGFIDWTAEALGILDAPRAVILIAITILLGIVLALSIALSRLRYQQLMLLRLVAQKDLAAQEQALFRDGTQIGKLTSTVGKPSSRHN